MSERRVKLHIGTEKTGSTAIQGFLAANRAALAQQGYTYSRIANETNHIAMAAYAVDAEKNLDLHRHNRVTTSTQEAFRRRIRKQLSAELDTGNIVVISNEHLSSKALEPDDIQTVASLFAQIGADVEVIVYLRRLVPMIEASYSTFVKSWRTQPFSFSFEVDRHLRYDLRALVDRWEAAFPGRVRVRLFREELKQQPTELLRDFLTTIGVDLTDDFIMPDGTSNPSLSREATELLRLINTALESHKTPERGLIRRLYIREAELGTLGPPFALSPAEAATVDSTYGPSIESLRSRIGDEFVDYLLSHDRPALAAEPAPTAEEERASAVGALITAAERAVAQQADKIATQRVDEHRRSLDTALKERDAAREELAAVRRSLATAHNELVGARLAAAELDRVTATRTWRWTAPARAAVARLRRRR